MPNRTDYFTRSEFRQVVADRTSPYKYDDADIDRAQAEVIARLERWAGSAWPNVSTEDPPAADGDGIASAPRSVTEHIYTVSYPSVTLGHLPVIELTADIKDDLDNTLIDISVDDHWLDLESGILTWGRVMLTDAVSVVVVSYTYGETECPWQVKRPCITAAASLLDLQENRGQIPRNVSQYQTERTTFVFGGNEPKDPWPWDNDSSQDIRSYWELERPRRFLVV